MCGACCTKIVAFRSNDDRVRNKKLVKLRNRPYIKGFGNFRNILFMEKEYLNKSKETAIVIAF